MSSRRHLHVMSAAGVTVSGGRSTGRDANPRQLRMKPASMPSSHGGWRPRAIRSWRRTTAVRGSRSPQPGRWDLVVLDLLLPGLSGLQVLRDLHRARPQLPALILSARSRPPDEAAGVRARGDRLCREAVRAGRAARARAGKVRGRTRSRTSILLAGQRRARPRTPAGRIGELVTDLSDREFRVLHQLLLHAGEVVSRERLLAEVWGYAFDPGSNVVDVGVRRLRQKLGPEDPIETVRNAGYRLAAA